MYSYIWKGKRVNYNWHLKLLHFFINARYFVLILLLLSPFIPSIKCIAIDNTFNTLYQ